MGGSPVCLVGQEAVKKLAKERKLLFSLSLRLAELCNNYLRLAEFFQYFLRLAEFVKNFLRIITSITCLCGNSYLGCLKS